MQARNLSVTTPGHSGTIDNSPPQVESVVHQRNTVAENMEIQLDASDPDNDVLLFTAKGLPDGVYLDSQGRFSGAASRDGTYSVTVSVSDTHHTADNSFDWQIKRREGTGAAWLLMWILVSATLQRRASSMPCRLC